jgi:hypothetical protein
LRAVRPVAPSAFAGALAALALAGCGSDDEPTTGGRTAPPPAAPAQAAPARGPIPSVLRTVESATEDTIDLALAGRRDKVVRNARKLKAAADGPAATELREAGVGAAEITDFRARAADVAKLAPTADLTRVALASNRAFALVPGFFARYTSPVPADVLRLDYLDFEAKLRARVGDARGLGDASRRLGATWVHVRPAVLRAGGDRAAARFDAHVAQLGRLVSDGGGRPAEREAQHGLDLVDELEEVYEG